MKYFTFLLILVTFQLNAQSIQMWQALNLNATNRQVMQIPIRGGDFYTLDFDLMRTLLSDAPNEFLRNTNPIEVNLPTGQGTIMSFYATQTNTLSPELHKRYPGINNFIVVAVDNPTVFGRIDYTHQGFHGILRVGTKTVYIDPVYQGDKTSYQVYNKSNLIHQKPHQCQVTDEHFDYNQTEDKVQMRVSDDNLRTYRLAVACTGEYANFHGGTKELVLSAINTSINRINFIYEHDIAVRLELVPDNDKIVFLNPTTDPYNNSNANNLFSVNQRVVDDSIGVANYDIGHVFSTGEGGVAALSSVCGSNKARGVTGTSQPVNDPFDIDYVAHEMGHQFGANHTQNNSCNRANSAAFEPGSASSIMGYAGICSPNVQNNSDAYFHGHSLIEITSFIINGNGNNCAVRTIIPGEKPDVMVSSVNHIIPRGTPFVLEAMTTSSDTLTYCWEQYNNEPAPMPPVASNVTGPLFRTYMPVLDNKRVFPALPYILSNATNTWETLPGVGRSMRFIVTAREHRSGGARHVQAFQTVEVANNAGPFRVESPNQPGIVWHSGEPVTIRWDVARTDGIEVNCPFVHISLSSDGGHTFPYNLLTTDNDGEEEIIVPEILGDSIRLKISGADNIFFDLSNFNFTIRQGPPAFSSHLSHDVFNTCENITDTILLAVIPNIDSILPVIVSVTDLPAHFSYTLERDTLNAYDSARLILTVSNEFEGTFPVRINFQNDSLNIDNIITVHVGHPAIQPELFYPPNESEFQANDVRFIWNGFNTVQVGYQFELASDKEFQDIIYTQDGIPETSILLPFNLDNEAIYYWRVNTANYCNTSEFSTPYMFRTGICTTVERSGLDKELKTGVANIITRDTLFFDYPSFTRIRDINVTPLDIVHQKVNDLNIRLLSSGNVISRLAEQLCSSEEDLKAGFDDDAELSSIPCGFSPLGIGLTVQPVTPLSVFNALNPNGEFVLVIQDRFAANGGTLNGWGLKICGIGENCAPLRIPEIKNTYHPDEVCRQEDGWVNYSLSAANNPAGDYDMLLVSIYQPDSTVILKEDINVVIAADDLFTPVPDAMYVDEEVGKNWAVLNRYININKSGDSAFLTRMYFTWTEADALLSFSGKEDLSDLVPFGITYTQQPGIDPNPVNLHVGINEFDTDLVRDGYVLGEYNTKYFVEMVAIDNSALCIGAGGIVKDPLSVSKTTNSDFNLNVFPNPVSSTLLVTFDHTTTMTYSLINANGQNVMSGKVSNTDRVTLNTNELPSGTYLLKCIGSEKTGVTKVMIINH